MKKRISRVGGFDFLGFNIRQYKTEKGKSRKLLIKLSKDSVKKVKLIIKDVFIRKKGRPVKELISELNTIIRGIGNYWQHVVSKKTYSGIDHYIFTKTVKYLKRLHPKKRKSKKNKKATGNWEWIKNQ